MSGTIVYLGIDPGYSGALAFYEPVADVLSVYDMPIFKLKKANGGTRTVVDVQTLARIFDEHATVLRHVVVYQEQVGTRPGEAASASFNFGVGVGILHGMIAAHYLRREDVAPVRWKRALACPADKDGARYRASQLMPKHAHLWPLVKHDGRAEASLIALYGSIHDGLRADA